MPKKFSIHDVIQDLNGTSLDLQTVLDDYGKDEEDLSESDRLTLNAELFCCNSCAWWCQVEEKNSDPETGICICNDCKENSAELDEYL